MQHALNRKNSAVSVSQKEIEHAKKQIQQIDSLLMNN
jgi:hypothetical protein